MELLFYKNIFYTKKKRVKNTLYCYKYILIKYFLKTINPYIITIVFIIVYLSVF